MADAEFRDAPEGSKVEESSTKKKVPTKKKSSSKRKIKKKKVAKPTSGKRPGGRSQAEYPRHTIEKSLRIPRAILEENHGEPCTDKDSAGLCGMGYHGPFKVELSSAIKYKLLDRPENGMVGLTDLGRQILKPKSEDDVIEGYRKAVLNAPVFSEVYKYFRGENLRDEPFFSNLLTDDYGIPADKAGEFKQLFIDTLQEAKLISRDGDTIRVFDVSQGEGVTLDSDENIRKLGKSAKIKAGDTCFVMMPFANPIGSYYKTIYEPAIQKAGLIPVRADDDIFTTGKIIEQVWEGIHSAKVLVAELTGRNPNVFYELGLAHALQLPVVLVSSNESDVPFDVKHIRVIFYDTSDPFWGDKLITKISENILSALTKPQDAIFKSPPTVE